MNTSILTYTLVLSAILIPGFALPNRSNQPARYSADEYSRKFGAAPYNDELSNAIEESSPEQKQDGGLMVTLIELATKFMPIIIDAISGNTGPSQTDRIEGIDLNGEDPFSWKNMLAMGLKLFLAVAGGGGSANEKADNTPMQAVMGTVISALTGSTDSGEVQVMAKQATEVINLVITLVEALTTSVSSQQSL